MGSKYSILLLNISGTMVHNVNNIAKARNMDQHDIQNIFSVCLAYPINSNNQHLATSESEHEYWSQGILF